MKREKIFVIFICIFLIALILIFFTGKEEPSEHVAIINDEIIVTLEEFKIYLREQIIYFEEIAGSDIWKVDFDGVPTQDIVKSNALLSVVSVKTQVQRANQLGIELSEEEIELISFNTLNVYESLGIRERELIDFYVLSNVMEEIALKDKSLEFLGITYNTSEDPESFRDIELLSPANIYTVQEFGSDFTPIDVSQNDDVFIFIESFDISEANMPVTDFDLIETQGIQTTFVEINVEVWDNIDVNLIRESINY